MGNAVIGPQGDPKTLESLQGNIDAKDAIYKRMLRALSGSEKSKKYARLSAADRRAVLEILRETKKDFPGVVN